MTTDMIEYLHFFHAGNAGKYEVRVHLMGSSHPDCLGHRQAHLEEILELLRYLEWHGPMMRFDDYPGKVCKVELSLDKRELVLRVKLGMWGDAENEYQGHEAV